MAILMTIFSGFYMTLMTWLYSEKKINKYIFCVLCGLLSGFFSIYFSHYSISGFSNIVDEITSYELFFLFSMKALSFLPMVVFFCLYAMLSFLVKLTLIEKVSRDPLLSLFCFFSFFFLYFDGAVVRVSLGVAVAYWGVYFLSKNKILHFNLIILISCLFFHYSLLILMVMPLFKTHFSIKIIFALIIIFFIVYVMGFGVLDPVLWVMSYLDTSISGLSKFNSYLMRSNEGDPYSLVLFFLFLACLFSYWLFMRELSDFELISYNMIFLSFLILIVFYQNQVFQNRFSEIFRYSLVFISPFFYRFFFVFIGSRFLSNIAYIFLMGGYFVYFYYYKEIIPVNNLDMIDFSFVFF
ncbi:EpsG family protein [Marinomonas sp.]|uniref:EpsG family protein n=1 Tax=Marinomonas sp. TaxID=1904862 RepID=UPI003BAB77D0